MKRIDILQTELYETAAAMEQGISCDSCPMRKECFDEGSNWPKADGQPCHTMWEHYLESEVTEND